MNERGPSISWWRTLGWAFYLACSWTWCIGMFLPVLLVRDYGVWGFVVFAVPNVVGAAAMGWVLREPGASERIVQKHRMACLAFSWITIAFHSFFEGWVASWLSIPLIGCALGAFAAAAVLTWVVGGSGRPSPRTAVSVLALSIGALAVFWVSGAVGMPRLQSDDRVLWLAPVVVFGFALCPYLDLSFHRARQQLADTEARAAFAVGFGVVFLIMILFTLAYATWLDNAITAAPIVVSAAGIAVFSHMAVQVLFTGQVHTSEVMPTDKAAMLRWARNWGIAWTPVLFAGFLAGRFGTFRGLNLGEIGYRCFMGFYGLVFPAYVWLLMIPTRDGHSGLGGASGRRKMLIWAGAVGVAAPMFWMGFVEQREVWLAPGLGAVLLARLVLPRRDGGATSATAAGRNETIRTAGASVSSRR